MLQISQWVGLDYPKVGIIATIGPSVCAFKRDPGQKPSKNGKPMFIKNELAELLKAGVSAFRINFSHVSREGDDFKCSYDEVHAVISAIRDLETEYHTPIPIIMDLKGPEIRIQDIIVDDVKYKGVSVDTKTIVHIHQVSNTANGIDQEQPRDEIYASKFKRLDINVTYEGDFFVEVQRDNVIRIDDGRISFRVIDRHETEGWVKCEISTMGIISINKSVNLPDRNISTVDSVIAKDLQDLAMKFPVDFIAQSFVRTADDVTGLAATLAREYGPPENRPLIIAKIETRESVKCIDGEELRNFKRILESPNTFGVMIGRGDLGGELGIENVPPLQQAMIELANRVGRPAIVATQMLESMRRSPVPTRAEAQDVWSSIMQGADAVMLSGETADGKYPVGSVTEMRKIIRNARLDVKHYRARFQGDFMTGGLHKDPKPVYAVEVVGYPVVTLAEQSKSPFIITYATKGWSATKISRFRPDHPTRVLGLTVRPRIARILRLLYGVYPILLSSSDGPTDPNEADLPREGDPVIELSCRVLKHICERAGCPDREDGYCKLCRSRYIVATFAHRKPVRDFDINRFIIVFKYGAPHPTGDELPKT